MSLSKNWLAWSLTLSLERKFTVQLSKPRGGNPFYEDECLLNFLPLKKILKMAIKHVKMHLLTYCNSSSLATRDYNGCVRNFWVDFSGTFLYYWYFSSVFKSMGVLNSKLCKFDFFHFKCLTLFGIGPTILHHFKL